MVNEKIKRQKEVIYPILYECSKLQTDDFWRSLFEDLSRGKCPKGIMIYNGIISSANKRNGFSYNVNNKTIPEEVTEELINILKSSACIYSSNDIENKETSIQDSALEYSSITNFDSFKKIKTRKMKENLILNYIFKIKDSYKLTNKKTKELYENIKGALFEYKTHKSEDVLMKNGEIYKIIDFEYDKSVKSMVNLRVNIFEEKLKEETTKDVLGSKWEKYVKNVIKSVVKEEI